MLTVVTYPLELRGVSNRTTNSGKPYYILNVESVDGTPHSLYCPKLDAIPAGLKKGDMIQVTCNVRTYDRNERLVVERVALAE